MEVELDLHKNLSQNANNYFERAKKIKKKFSGIQFIIEKTKEELELLEENYRKEKTNSQRKNYIKSFQKKHWYSRFRWTKTSFGELFVFGSDATSNEILIKKHTEKKDLVFHTSSPKSPFGLLKRTTDNLNQKSIFEAAQVLASFSSQWRLGFGFAEVFWVYPNQVSKTPRSGEYIQKGSFMIKGRKNILKHVPLELGIGLVEHKGKIDGDEITRFEEFSGTKPSCERYCKKFVRVIPGRVNLKQLNSQLKKKLNHNFENLPKLLPKGVAISK